MFSPFLLVDVFIRALAVFPLVVLPFIRTGHLSLPSGLGLLDLVMSLLSSFSGLF